MFFFAEVGPEGGRELAAKYVVEGAGQVEVGWELVPEVLLKVCDSLSRFSSTLSNRRADAQR